MKPLALVAAARGYSVSGTDAGYGNDSSLAAAGIAVQRDMNRVAASSADLYAFSSAIDVAHDERLAATAACGSTGRPVILHRMDLLNRLVADAPLHFALAGTHGKTSSTSMAGWLLLQAGFDPTIIAGGRPLYLPDGCRSGGDTAVYETDESDGSFLTARGRHRLILNVDRDHLNHYGDFASLCDAFGRFAREGRPVLFAADPVLAHFAADAWFAEAGGALFGPATERSAGPNGRAEKWAELPYYGARFDEGDALSFALYQSDTVRFEKTSGRLRLRLPGRHFAMNALGVMALVHSAIRDESILARRLDPDDPRTLAMFVEIMNEFPGVERRLERIGMVGTTPVYDDYGHHPTEIRAVLDALSRRGERPLCVVFQPHRFTRTRELAAEFAESLGSADRVYLLPLYSAGEHPIDGISSASIGERMNGRALPLDPGEFGRVFEDSWGAVLFLGAGSISRMARTFLAEGAP